MRLYTCILTLILISSYSCKSDNKTVVVDFQGPSPSTNSISFHQDQAIHVGIASIMSAKETYNFYNDILHFISEQLEMPIHFIQKESYREINDLLAKGAVDFAFVGSGEYADLNNKNIAKLLVIPVSNRSSKFNSYIIANKKLNVNSFIDLKGKNFAYTDPLSLSGYYYPVWKIKSLGYNEHNFFNKTMLTYGNDISCEMVNKGIIDAAGVSSFIFDYIKSNYPENVRNIKIIDQSKPFTSPPIVVPAKLDNKKVMLYKNIFLNFHKNMIGKEILNNINVDYYIEGNNSDYVEVRKLINEAGR